MAALHRRVSCFLLLVICANAVTPIQKVLQLMSEMKAKGVAEKNEEEKKCATFLQWSTDHQAQRNTDIANQNDKIAELQAVQEKMAVNIKDFAARIAELTEDNGRWEKDLAQALHIRTQEAADNAKAIQDYKESNEALRQAIAVLKKQDYDRGQAAAALIQVRSLKLVPLEAKSALSAFLQETPLTDDGYTNTEAIDGQGTLDDLNAQRESNRGDDTGMAYAAPEANAYEFQSGGVVDVLEKLYKEFSEKQREAESEEAASKAAYEMLRQQLTDATEKATAEIDRKVKRKADAQKTKEQANAEEVVTTKNRDEDQTYLNDLVALTQQKKTDCENRQALRAAELEAIDKAMEIIAGATVNTAGDKRITETGAALAQVSSDAQNPLQKRVAAFLASRAESSGSQLLAMISERVANDAFTKVKKMIQDLIWKLQEEATEEAEHHGWCQAELRTSEITRAKHTQDKADLTANIEELNAKIADNKQRITDLTAKVADLRKTLAEATQTRQEDSDANKQTIAEAKAGGEAVNQAITVLKEFYEKAATATSLTQQTPMDDAPETFDDKPYTGMAGGGGIVSFLEVILSDMERLEQETIAAEDSDANKFDKFKFDTDKDIALKENEIKHLNESTETANSDLANAKNELKDTEEQLTKAEEYYDRLKPTCVDSGISYEERVKRREAEMQSLREAKAILEGTDVDLPNTF